jgi:uncharacterized membrane protein
MTKIYIINIFQASSRLLFFPHSLFYRFFIVFKIAEKNQFSMKIGLTVFCFIIFLAKVRKNKEVPRTQHFLPTFK